MALSSVSAVKTLLGISDSSQDTLLTQLLAAADAAVKTYIRRGKAKTAFTSWPESGADTMYFSGEGTPDLILPYWPVTAVASVYLDAAGYFGDGANAFSSATLLTAGVDYVLYRDDGAASVTARLRRLGGISSASTGGGLGGDYGWWPGLGAGAWQTAGPLWMNGRVAAAWPVGHGNVKVTFTAGYSSVPADLADAVNQIAIFRYSYRKMAGPMQSESLGDYSYSLAALNNEPMLGTARSILAGYRELPI